MNSAPDTPPDGTALREVLGLVLIVLGVAAVIFAAFLVDPRLGIASIGASVAGVGVLLSLGEA